MKSPKFAITLAITIITLTHTHPRPAAAVTDQQVAQAIEQIQQYLYSKQDPDTGTWEFRSNPGGVKRDAVQRGAETAVVTKALLVSGESSQNPMLEKAIRFLKNNQPKGTYAVAMRAHVWADMPYSWTHLLEQDAASLLRAANRHPKGLFYYHPEQPTPFVDNGVVQYGVLGLWEASKHGYRTPRKYWQTWQQHFLDSQRPDGNWRYAADAQKNVGGAGSGNIFDTTGIGDAANAGLTAMLIIQQELFRARKTPDPATHAAINKALAWLDKNFDPNTGNSGYNHYYLFGIERIAAACGVRFLNNQDWYQTGAEQIIQQLKHIESTESDSIQMAFALMFLSRGRYPVWIAKLQIPNARWNNRPNDLYFLNLYLSDEREGQLNWQVTNIDQGDPDDWLMSPVLYLSSDRAVRFTDTQLDRLKKYLDRGGLLVTCAENRSREFTKSIHKLSNKLYPQYPLKPLQPNDPINQSWYPNLNEYKIPIHAVSNGARHLILSVEEDWGYPIQAGNFKNQSAPILASNLFAYATSRGVTRNRLEKPFQERIDKPTNNTAHIGLATHNNQPTPEPAAWDVFADHIANQSATRLTTETIDLENIANSKLKLIHFAGVQPVKLNKAQLDAIKTYTQRGGTILVETVGGQGDFARDFATQLSNAYNINPINLTSRHPIINGHRIPNATDCRRTAHRRFAVWSTGFEPTPRLKAFTDQHDQPRVIISDLDISTALLGTQHWGIIGYRSHDARRLLANIVHWANHSNTLTQPGTPSS